MKSISSVFAALAVFLLLGLPAMAQPEVYGIGTDLDIIKFEEGEVVEPEAIPFNDSVLYSINPNTGAPTEIGPISGYTQCTGLDIHPVTEVLYAVCNIIETNGEVMDTNSESFGTKLLTLNNDTGQATEIGALDLPRGDFVSDISFRSDGTLFAHINGSLAKAEEDITTSLLSANTLGIIDTQTGNLTILGSTGSDDFWSAIGFTPTDLLIQCTDNDNFPGVANSLNQTTGHATFLENLIYPPQFDGVSTILSKDFDLSSGQFLAFLEPRGECCDDILLTNNHTPPGSYLVRINSNNGDIDLIGQTSGFEERFGAIAVSSQRAQVPTLSEYGLILTVVMLLGVAVVFLRRRQAKSEI